MKFVCPRPNTLVCLATPLILALFSAIPNAFVHAQGPAIPPPRPLASLKSVAVPLPSNLDDFNKDREAAIMLGKALFWDMQAGSDGKTACASCHWHAGADARFVNTLAPPEEFRESTPLWDPLKELKKSDFPFIKRANPDPSDPTDPFLNSAAQVVERRDEVLGSQGAQKRDFQAIQPWRSKEFGSPANDPVFSVHGTNLRTVTSRNSPTVINAVFNHWPSNRPILPTRSCHPMRATLARDYGLTTAP